MDKKLFTPALSPESVGVPSGAVSRMLARLTEKTINMHSFMVVRGGRIAAEGYWPPFTPDFKHRMYSISKSFTSLAIGCLIEEGRLSLEDQVWRFFPDKVPEKMHPWLEEATVRDLLMMATPHSEQSYTVADKDWVWTFFNKEPSHPAGTIFSYDTAGTVVLSTIVERLTGMTFIEYLRPKLLDPIGASEGISCIKTPEGTSWGGSGVLCTLKDMAKIGYVCMHHGRWDDQQLLSQEYVDAAIACQIDNSHAGHCGYGYQIWRIPDNGFAFFGMGSQYGFFFPDKDLLFACTADTQADTCPTEGAILEAAEEMQRAVITKELPEDAAASAALAQQIAQLHMQPLKGETSSPAQAETNGVWYTLEPNPMNISRLRLVFHEQGGTLEYENARGCKKIEFELGAYCTTEFPEYYFDEQIGVNGSRRYRSLNTAAWVKPNSLYIRCCVSDTYFGGLQIVLSFKGEQIALQMLKVAEWFFDDYQGFAGGSREA